VRPFLYGTLLDPATLAARSGEPASPMRCQRAVLRGWRRVTLARTPWPTSRRCAGGVVAGNIGIAGAAASRHLAAYEGPAYRLRRIVVEPRIPAWAGIAAGGTGAFSERVEPVRAPAFVIARSAATKQSPGSCARAGRLLRCARNDRGGAGIGETHKYPWT
jgi:hypothetical protein